MANSKSNATPTQSVLRKPLGVGVALKLFYFVVMQPPVPMRLLDKRL
jgi:hypothetical protein